MENFYKTLSSFRHFNGIADANFYEPVPEDWAIFISDVRGSTSAIAAGKYKEVNMIGAASIVVTRNAIGSLDFPFVFGGDGATMLIPPSKIEDVTKQLSALKSLARQNFNLDLRVGMVRVDQLYEAKKKLEVARFELTPGRSIAMFRGDGITHAEEWIKKSGEKYEVSLVPESENDLAGLSCRWLPIKSKNGKILTLIVFVRNKVNALAKLLEEMESIFPEGMESLNPAVVQQGHYKSVLDCLKEEIKYNRHLSGFEKIKHFFQILFSVAIFKYKMPFSLAPEYLQSISTHSDFRKFDNMLRMVIDCTLEQIVVLKDLFARLHSEGIIYYGTFEAENSLMTCFVENLNQGKHIHFMDGENGGYAMASEALKRQMGEMDLTV